ncbi:helix-turn-helix domain-containing protein [Kitasatospora sp. NPDC051984]|uniref:helix-turn-helix domain-containing protein n=1 Tax=Kitasatospora sp. NPDC051984 TaxID=3364059 RepID=UPI0037C83FE7
MWVWRDALVLGSLAELDFGGLSKRLRDLLQLHQNELADITGLTQGYVSRLESGQVRLTHIDRIVDYLDAVGTPPDLARLPLRAASAPATRDSQITPRPRPSARTGPPADPAPAVNLLRVGLLRSPA